MLEFHAGDLEDFGFSWALTWYWSVYFLFSLEFTGIKKWKSEPSINPCTSMGSPSNWDVLSCNFRSWKNWSIQTLALPSISGALIRPKSELNACYTSDISVTGTLRMWRVWTMCFLVRLTSTMRTLVTGTRAKCKYSVICFIKLQNSIKIWINGMLRRRKSWFISLKMRRLSMDERCFFVPWCHSF